MKWQAYRPEWAFYAALRAHAARWQRQQLLSAAQLSDIEAAYPLDYHQPAWPLRVGLFIFSWIGLGMMGGFWFLIAHEALFLALLLSAIGYFVLLELVIQNTCFYHNGADNALLYASLGTTGTLIFYVFSQFIWPDKLYYHLDLTNPLLAPPLLLTLTVLLAATVRYADALVAAAAFGNVVLLAVLVGEQSALGQALLPFLVMTTAAGTLVLHRLLRRRVAGTSLADYYASCFLTLKVLGLAVFYLGGNYLVVREGNASLRGLYESVQIPFAPVFYVLTAGIPLLYIVLGLRRADRPTLLVGVVALAFSVFTLRHYRSLMPPEIAAVLAGTVLTIAAGALLRYLRPARAGFTSLPDDEPRYFNLENLVQAQTAYVPGAPAGSFEFGGGQSGGGGATGQF